MGTDDEEEFGGPPPDPSLRAWRHPSEVAAAAAAAAAAEREIESDASGRQIGGMPRTAVLVGAAGVALCVGILLLSSVSLVSTSNPGPGLESADVLSQSIVEPTQKEAESGFSGSNADDQLVATTVAPSTTLPATTTTLPWDSLAYSESLPNGVYSITRSGEPIAHAIGIDGLLVTSARATANLDNLTLHMGDDEVPISVEASDGYTDVALLAPTDPAVAFESIGEFADVFAGDQIATTGPTPLAPSDPLGEVVTTDFRATGSDGRPIFGAMLTSIETDRTDAGSLLVDDQGLPVGLVIRCDSMLTVGVPLHTVWSVATDLYNEGHPQSAWLGIEATVGVRGLRLVAVTEDGPAAAAGLEVGDIITSFNGVGLADIADLAEQLRLVEPGPPVEAVVERDGTVTPVQIVIDFRP